MSIWQEYLVWMPLWPRNFVCGKVMVYSYGSPLVITQRGAQAPVFDISRQSSTRRPTTAHLLKIWPCCRSFTGTRRPDGGSPSRRSSQIAARVTFDWGNGSRHGDGTVFHAHARVIITQWSFCSSYTIFSCAVIRDVCLCFYRLFIIQEVLIARNSNLNREPYRYPF